MHGHSNNTLETWLMMVSPWATDVEDNEAWASSDPHFCDLPPGTSSEDDIKYFLSVGHIARLTTPRTLWPMTMPLPIVCILC